jgi:hypothetical protein
MKMIVLVFLFACGLSLESVYSQENLEPYEKYDSVQRVSKQSLLIESGSFVNAKFSLDAVYLIKFDSPFYILKYNTNGYAAVVANGEKKSLEKQIKKLASLPYYKCPSDIKAKDQKKLKGRDYDSYWKYRLVDVDESKNGEGRVKHPLINDCTSLFAAMKERKVVNKILRELRYLPSTEVTSRK